MTGTAVKPGKRNSKSLLQRWLGMIAACLGLAGGTGLAAGTIPAVAEGRDYRASESAPAAWREFALKVQTRLRERLAVDDERTEQLHRRLEERASGEKVQFIVTKVWMTPTGSIERLEFDDVDGEIAVTLRGILARQEIGSAPPPGMLQPLHLKLSLQRAG